MDSQQPVDALIKQLRDRYVAQNPDLRVHQYERIEEIETPRGYLTHELPGELHYRADDSPLRGGRMPEPGENLYTFHWTLEDGTVLYLEMGEPGFKRFRGWILQMELDDAADQAMGKL